MIVTHVATRGREERPLALAPIVTRTLSPRDNTRMPTGRGIRLDRMKRGRSMRWGGPPCPGPGLALHQHRTAGRALIASSARLLYWYTSSAIFQPSGVRFSRQVTSLRM